MSINTGTLPEDWRNANIAPIFKKGNRHLAENYRPVSLTSISCKLLEHIICKHLLTHFENHKILSSLNHGFRSGFSCETQLLVTVDDLMKSFDQGKQTDVVILDFSKAFDTVPHDKLLAKLSSFGINGCLLSWFEAFLTKRKMRVVCEGEFSKYVPVESGVPQGTVLGPILFLCHINDLPDCVSSQVRLFADDCLLYRCINSERDFKILQDDLRSLEKWALDWGMKFNPSKCYIMTISGHKKRKQLDFYYDLCNHVLEKVHHNPYLGVQFSADLKWSTHIGRICNKASSTLGFLQRNISQCSRKCKKIAYISLVRSKLEYASLVWDPYLQQDIEKIEKIQRKAARFILNDYTTRTTGFITDALSTLDLPKLENRRFKNRMNFFFKMSNDQIPAINRRQFLDEVRNKRKICAKSYENFYTNNHVNKSIRNNTRCYKQIFGNSDQYRNSFFPRSIPQWNSLAESTVQAKDLDEFKTKISSLKN